MQLDKARSFLESNHRAVLCTRRQDGSPLMSPVVCALDEEGKVVVSTRETAMKTRHIRREGAMSLCVMGEGFFGEWIQVDGPVQIVELPEAMEGLVSYYRSVGGEHPDWDDYRRSMEAEQRVLLRMTIERAGPDRSG